MMARSMPILLFLLAVVPAHAADVEGSEDHPLVTRYPDAEITWYDRQEYEPYKIAIGPVTGYRHIDDWTEVEGRITRINYTLDGERSFYEVYSNYLNAIKRAGFEILAEGFNKSSNVGREVGGRGFLGVHYAANPFPPGASAILTGSSTSGGSGYFAARLERPEDTVCVVLGAVQYTQDRIVAMVDVIEQQAMEGDLIGVDAEAMSKDIDVYGKVALYGLYFEHDSATLKPQSLPALQEIAKLLKNRPDLEVYVVGHTDMTGTLEYNLRLSRDRAQSVVDALREGHGITAARLEAQGIGPLVPVFTNRNDPGRSKNRRVELVQR